MVTPNIGFACKNIDKKCDCVSYLIVTTMIDDNVIFNLDVGYVANFRVSNQINA